MKSLLTGNELLAAVKGTQIGSSDCLFNDVQTDSRNVSANCMFVPLVGEFQNGHKYIPQAIEKGASVVLINREEYEMNKQDWSDNLVKYPDVFFVIVENTLHGLQDAAEAYVNKVAGDMIRVSITGSSGKTTTKEMMVSVCKAYFGENNVAYTKGNFNSETGLPLSVFKIRGDEKIGIFEMGMNRENEIGEISKVWKSQYGIITNIGTAHIGILGSQENIAREKRKSFDYIPADGAAVVGATDPFADYCTENVKGKIIKFGKNVAGSGVEYIEDKGLFGSVFSVDGLKIQLSLSGEYNFLNATSVIACAKEIGIDAESIKKGLENVASVSGRMEIKQLELKNGNKVVLIQDCYNANLDSMLKVIDFCNGLKNVGKKIFVLADMKELGNEAEKSHIAIGKEINRVKPDFSYLIGCDMEKGFETVDDKSKVLWMNESSEKNFEEIGKKINETASENDVILLKGSHSMGLEKLVPYMGK